MFADVASQDASAPRTSQSQLAQHTENKPMNDDMENRSIRLDVTDRDWVRSVPIKAMFRPPEADDLETIAEGWGVPVATAAWAIIAEQLARWRRQAPDLGPHGLAIAAATTVLQMRPSNPYTADREQPHPVRASESLNGNT